MSLRGLGRKEKRDHSTGFNSLRVFPRFGPRVRSIPRFQRGSGLLGRDTLLCPSPIQPGLGRLPGSRGSLAKRETSLDAPQRSFHTRILGFRAASRRFAFPKPLPGASLLPNPGVRCSLGGSGAVNPGTWRDSLSRIPAWRSESPARRSGILARSGCAASCFIHPNNPQDFLGLAPGVPWASERRFGPGRVAPSIFPWDIPNPSSGSLLSGGFLGAGRFSSRASRPDSASLLPASVGSGRRAKCCDPPPASKWRQEGIHFHGGDAGRSGFGIRDSAFPAIWRAARGSGNRPRGSAEFPSSARPGLGGFGLTIPSETGGVRPVFPANCRRLRRIRENRE